MFLIEFNRFKPNFKNMRIGHSHKSHDSTYKHNAMHKGAQRLERKSHMILTDSRK